MSHPEGTFVSKCSRVKSKMKTQALTYNAFNKLSKISESIVR